MLNAAGMIDMFLQKTIRKKTTIEGVGLHSGQKCHLTFRPAPANVGVHFIRADLPNRPSLRVSAKNVEATSLQTTLGGKEFSVATVEHCMAALSALRIDNIYIELDGPEIPITDGSAKEFLLALQKVGSVELDQPRKYCTITKPISFVEGDKQAYVLPYDGLRLTVSIDFEHAAIGKQKIDLDINEHSFEREIAGARTFGFMKDIITLQEKGFARGASLKNAIGLDATSVVNPEGLQWPDEFVRHKTLDALGDLVTLEMPLMGHVVLQKAGHDLMNKLVRKIQDSPNFFRHVELGADLSKEMIRYAHWTPQDPV